MSTCIEAAATSHVLRPRLGQGALHLSDVAAHTCLARGHRRAAELDLLVNVGLYKDHSIAEPAFASIIQEDIGANPGHPPIAGHHGTFSFDVLNGGCGVITAAHLIAGFVGDGTAELGLVAAGDADPSPRTSRSFPFSPAGGALLLAHHEEEGGFERFAFRTFPEDARLFEVALRWDPNAGLARRGRNVLEVVEAPDFAGQCVEHAVEVARAMLAELGLAPRDLALLIASPYPRSFAPEVARRLEIEAERVPRVGPELARVHTAGPIAALEVAIEAGAFARARHTLFLTAGAGITIGAAYYRNPRR